MSLMVNREIRFVNKAGEIQTMPASEMLRQLGVGSVIRIPQKEYPVLAQPGQKFWHLNLPIHDGKLGEWVLLAEIIENGHRVTDHDNPPLLSFEHAFLARTIYYLSSAPQAMFHQDWVNSTIGLKTAGDIPTLIQKRYGAVRGISHEEAVASPIAIRRFKLRQFLGVKALNALQ